MGFTREQLEAMPGFDPAFHLGEKPREKPAPTAPELGCSEEDFQAWIIALAEVNGWLVYHTYNSKRSKPGFPDLVLTRAGEIIFAEVKTTKGKVSDFQRQWLDALGLHIPCCEHCKLGIYVWRPNDWDFIVQTLR